MRLADFIRQHRAELDSYINSAIYRWDGNGGYGQVPDPPPRYNDKDRRDWILNDEGLYRWARSEGCKI